MTPLVPQIDFALFATLRGNARIWAVGAIHSEIDRLTRLHRQIAEDFLPGDQIVYLGNYSGHGRAAIATIDELLLFRRAILALPGVDMEDVVFLRGAQEEMWQKLLQLQFAPDPAQVLRWMVEQGIGPTVEAYGASLEDGASAGRDGTLALTRWTSQLRQSMRNLDGHTALMNALRHAAITETQNLLFVHAGIDPDRPLEAQGDSFWWGGSSFAAMNAPYLPFLRVVRGYDRRHGGVAETPHTLTLDGGSGFGGELTCACLAPDGTVLRLIST